jgi:hypothetical protein
MGSCSPWGLHGSSPGPIAGLLFVIALLATDLLHSTGHAHPVGVPYLIVAGIAVLVGLYFGRIGGLRQLGESDFRVRLRNAGGISRWL